MPANRGSSVLNPQLILDEAVDAVQVELARGDLDFALGLALDAFKALVALEPETLAEPHSTGDA
ncbi:hypothetical protein SAT01_16620 [Sinomonas atrocyanea]|nr:hypothetical protein SAT01_16620 [Sinomonas atrocyanea]GGG57293.1 hypothetical protein GCM10007172_05210 [Sinomonas atrocyanea]